jgi:hypothetical protein
VLKEDSPIAFVAVVLKKYMRPGVRPVAVNKPYSSPVVTETKLEVVVPSSLYNEYDMIAAPPLSKHAPMLIVIEVLVVETKVIDEGALGAVAA